MSKKKEGKKLINPPLNDSHNESETTACFGQEKKSINIKVEINNLRENYPTELYVSINRSTEGILNKITNSHQDFILESAGEKRCLNLKSE
jgi:hypothetical protein